MSFHCAIRWRTLNSPCSVCSYIFHSMNSRSSNYPARLSLLLPIHKTNSMTQKTFFFIGNFVLFWCDFDLIWFYSLPPFLSEIHSESSLKEFELFHVTLHRLLSIPQSGLLFNRLPSINGHVGIIAIRHTKELCLSASRRNFFTFFTQFCKITLGTIEMCARRNRQRGIMPSLNRRARQTIFRCWFSIATEKKTKTFHKETFLRWHSQDSFTRSLRTSRDFSSSSLKFSNFNIAREEMLLRGSKLDVRTLHYT